MHFRHLKIATFLSLATLLASCGGGKADPSGEFQTTTSSIIIGDLDWEEISVLKSGSLEQKNALAVAHVDLPVMGSRCTGFLISDDVVMTNQHCIPTLAHAKGVTVSFEVIAGVPKGSEKRFDCSEFIGNNQALDFALLKCKGNPGRQYGKVELTEEPVQVGEPVYVVQQNCDYYSKRDCYYTKKISFGEVSHIKGNSYTHNADTLGGSSGSPIFSQDTHEVVAIHHAGLGNNGQGRGLENYGVSMSEIVSHIKENFPAVLGAVSAPAPSKPSNDTPEGAMAMKLGTTYKGSIGSTKDVDFFKFTLSSSSSVKIELNISTKADLDLYVVNSNEQILARSEGTSSKEQIKGTAAAGTYYVLVKGYRGAQGTYRLKVSK